MTSSDVTVPSPSWGVRASRRQAWLLTTRRGRYLVMRSADATSAQRRHGGLRNRAAIDRMLGRQEDLLRRIISAVAGVPSTATRATPAQLRLEFEQALRSRRLVVLPVKRVSLESGSGALAPQPADATPLHKNKPEPVPQYWIEIELIDEQDRPVPGHAFQVIAPHGTVISGRLAANGVARVELDVPGECQISFVELDRDSWEPAI